MEKEFVTYELALRMKALGFDYDCLTRWGCTSKELYLLAFKPLNNKEIEVLSGDFISAPTWQSAFDWFGEKYQLYASVVVDQTSYPKYAYEISRFIGNPKDLTEGEWDWDDMIFSPSLYRTTIEAKMYCLAELINIAEKI